MLDRAKSRTIEELSDIISAEVLRKLEIFRELSVLPLSENYNCTGKGYICGLGYTCSPKKVHSCANYFECSRLYSESNLVDRRH
jgi:hypothetical protein